MKTRLTLIKAKVKKNITIGSWHGPNRGRDPSRKEVVKELCLYMGTISAGNPWIVGGDFIVENSKIKNDIPENIKKSFSRPRKNYIFSPYK